MAKQDRPAHLLAKEIARLLDCAGGPSDTSWAQCAERVNELASVLHRMRLPPSSDLHAAVAYGYVSMLKRAMESGDAQMVRLELLGLSEQLSSTRPKS